MPSIGSAARVLTLLVTVTMLSCAPGDSGAPAPMEPQYSHVSEGATAPTADMYLIREPVLNLLPGALSLSQVVGIGGGSIQLLGHELTVPAGAVTLPTVFTMTVLPTGFVQVELLAVRTSLLRRLLNIGSTGFAKPVPVTLTYARATNVTDPARLRIMRVKLNGRHEVLPSVVDTHNRTVTAKLSHFSRFAMVSD